MIRRSIAVCTAILALCLGAAPLAAQAAAPYKSTATPDQIADAKAQVKASKVVCEVVDVRYAGTATKKTDNKSVVQYGYEVTCAKGPGYLVQGVKGGSDETVASSCVALHAEMETSTAKEKITQCEIPANKEFVAGAQFLADQAGLSTCKVGKYGFFGASKATHDAFYEVACDGGGSYVLDVVSGVGDKVEAIECLKAEAQRHLTCKLAPPGHQYDQIAALAAKTGKTCPFSKARFVASGVDPALDYYEIGCAGGAPGFMVGVDASGALQKIIDCARASGLAGGCTLTDPKVLQASLDAGFADRLKANNISCAYEKARMIGQAGPQHQDVVEYSCSDRPRGLVVMFPAATGGKAEVYDCISVKHFATTCQFVTREALLADLTKAMALTSKACTVSDYAYFGGVDDGVYTLEVACNGAGGMIADFPLSGGRPKISASCALAAKQGDPCTLPGNK